MSNMHTQLLPAWEGLDTACALLQNGELVGFPTETVYGLGADARNAQAVLSIFSAKRRPADNPLIVHIADWEQLLPLVSEIPQRAKVLADAFWPGPLTMIFPRNPAVIPPEVSAGLATVAVRMPSHPVAQELIRRSGVPIAAPSGNRSGRPSPTLAAHMMQDMDGVIPLILDGGPCQVGLESTVIDITGDTPILLRPGGISREMLSRALGEEVPLGLGVMEPVSDDTPVRSPGLKHRHYAPNARVQIVQGSAEATQKRICQLYDENAELAPVILCIDADRPVYGDRFCLSLGSDPQDAAHWLFARLREADELQRNLILFASLSHEGVGLAVMNRIARAAGFAIERV